MSSLLRVLLVGQDGGERVGERISQAASDQVGLVTAGVKAAEGIQAAGAQAAAEAAEKLSKENEEREAAIKKAAEEAQARLRAEAEEERNSGCCIWRARGGKRKRPRQKPRARRVRSFASLGGVVQRLPDGRKQHQRCRIRFLARSANGREAFEQGLGQHDHARTTAKRAVVDTAVITFRMVT